MNIADPRYGPGLWVCLRLPDGRRAAVGGGDPVNAPVVAAIRRIHAAKGSPEDYAAVAAWLDAREPLPDGHLFTLEAAR